VVFGVRGGAGCVVVVVGGGGKEGCREALR
jgi:hypothetical protein